MVEPSLNSLKFKDLKLTLTGDERAFVPFKTLKTLWFNTGTLCNLACENCYIESSPTNDALVYLTVAEVQDYLDEVTAQHKETQEIGFTGGEPFVNPHMMEILTMTLERGFDALILTNAMRPMLRASVAEQLLELKDRFGDRLTMRVSLDHYTSVLHEKERGPGSWQPAVKGMDWLSSNGFDLHVAGRTCWGESMDDARDGYNELFKRHGWDVDAYNSSELVLFPEMEMETDLPEISTGCWQILGKKSADMMCATSRMVVKRRGETLPTVVACTLLPYSRDFDYGTELSGATKNVSLNHPHCARFCVLGGASCSG
jgi:sulfatase maturation enzyme AslB (radical SAM superfamily)